jgi:hypothetical protein
MGAAMNPNDIGMLVASFLLALLLATFTIMGGILAVEMVAGIIRRWRRWGSMSDAELRNLYASIKRRDKSREWNGGRKEWN